MDLILRAFIGLSVLLVVYLLSKDRGEREPKTALWAAAGFGVLALVLAAVLEGFFVKLDPSGSLGANRTVLRGSMLIGLIEESAKFIPLAIFIYHKRYFNEHTDGVIYFAIAGLAFGLPENLLYTLGGGVAAGIVRLILTPYFHAATTATIGYFLIRHKISKRPFGLVVLAYVSMVVAHGMYDFGMFSGVGWYTLLSLGITATVTGALFWFIRRALKLDQNMGLAAVGKNNYCRSCGYPNPKHNLYCTRCGRRT